MNRNPLNLAIREVSRTLSVPQDLVEQVYNSYWSFIRRHIISLPLKEITEEEAKHLITNFNIPYVGKLHVDYTKIHKYNNQLKFYQNVKNQENQASRLSSISD